MFEQIIKSIFRYIRYLRYLSVAMSIFFAVKGLIEFTNSFMLTIVFVCFVTVCGMSFGFPYYVYDAYYCNTDQLSRNQKIRYAIVTKVIHSVGVMGCAILSANVGYNIEFTISSASYMADFMLAIFFLSFGVTFLVDFGFLDVIVAWFLSSLWDYDETVEWLGDKLSIEGNRESQQACLIILFGFTLCLRNILLPVFMFLDSWAWSNDTFCTHLGRFVGYTGNDGNDDNDGDNNGGGNDNNDGDNNGGSSTDTVISTDLEAGPRPIPREIRRNRRVSQSHGDLRFDGVGHAGFENTDIGSSHRHSASFSLPSQQIQPYRFSIPEKKTCFNELGLTGELMRALREMGISVPTEIQSTGVPAVLNGKSVMLLSNPASGKTLAYLLPLVQLMRIDEALHSKLIKPRRPRAFILCSTEETSQQVFRVAKTISRHASFKPIMVTSADGLRHSLDSPIDMVIGARAILDNAMDYGDIKYVVFDQLDSMLNCRLGPGIIMFLKRLIERQERFQTILVSEKLTVTLNKFIHDEFGDIQVLRTSTYGKQNGSARHDFIQLPDSENKMKVLLQVLKPSLARGNKVMIFCNTLVSSRAVDHFLNENQVSTLTFYERVTAEERVEYLEKCKSDDGYCPTLIFTDMAIRGCDLVVEHLIMFDFPSNPIEFIHHSRKLAHLVAKGEVTSLVGNADQNLAYKFKQAVENLEKLESLSTRGSGSGSIRRDVLF